MNELFKQLEDKTNCSFTLEYNPHKDSYQTIEEYFENVDEDCKSYYEEIAKRNTLIELRVYPDTPIGFYVLYHYDIEMALIEMLETLNET